MMELLVPKKPASEMAPRSKKTEWSIPDEKIDLGNHDLHIWRINLEDMIPSKNLLTLLSGDEIKRAKRLVVPEKRQTFIAGRSALRLILAQYTGLNPQEIGFGHLPDGKPFLANKNQLNFNVSHSGHWIVIAVSAEHPVGVDVETITPIRAKNWALDHLFTVQDKEIIEQLPVHLQDPVFIAAWIMKEAQAKALGIGVGRAEKDNVLDIVQKIDFSEQAYQLFLKNPYWFIGFSPASGTSAMAAVWSAERPLVHFWNFNTQNYFDPK